MKRPRSNIEKWIGVLITLIFLVTLLITFYLPREPTDPPTGLIPNDLRPSILPSVTEEPQPATVHEVGIASKIARDVLDIVVRPWEVNHSEQLRVEPEYTKFLHVAIIPPHPEEVRNRARVLFENLLRDIIPPERMAAVIDATIIDWELMMRFTSAWVLVSLEDSDNNEPEFYRQAFSNRSQITLKEDGGFTLTASDDDVHSSTQRAPSYRMLNPMSDIERYNHVWKTQ